MYCHSWKIKNAISHVEDHAEDINDHFELDKIKINPGKTEFIKFTQKKEEKHTDTINVFNKSVKASNKVKYLGVILDKKLNFIEHVNYTSEKVNKAIGALIPLIGRRSQMSTQNKILVYKVVIQPAILYAAPAWGGIISKQQLSRLQKIQNRCLRMALRADRRTPTAVLHERAKVQMVEKSIEDHAKRFYQNLQIENLDELLLINEENTPYKIKHTLPQLKFI